MNLLQDVITYIRRIIKTPSDVEITDNLLIDYINRFWIMDVDARIQLFDLKTKYMFQTTPNVDRYNMPLYSIQTESGPQNINFYPVYQGFFSPCTINGIQVTFSTQHNQFINLCPDYVQNVTVAQGDGTTGPYTLQIPFTPAISTTVNQPASGIIRGHIDINGIIQANTISGIYQDPLFGTSINTNVPSTSIYPAVYITSTDAFGNNILVQDSGQFLQSSGNNYANLGLLMQPGNAPFGYSALTGGYGLTTNVINYSTGQIYVTFPTAIPSGQNINVQCYFFNPGLPRAVLFYNNILTLRNIPDKQYLVEIDGYLSPAAFLNTSSAIQYAYMAEYIARGAARKLLSDTGDLEQLQFYEPFFKEQEMLVWKRSQRQFTATRTETIYSNRGLSNGLASNGLYGSGAT